VALYAAVSVFGEWSTFHPARWGDGPSPAALGMAYRDVAFKDRAGLTLRGWWIPGTANRTIVMVHGWTSSRRETTAKAAYLHAAGYNILVFDLRGHGTSAGTYTTMGYYEPDDVRAAIDLARAQAPGSPVALLGYSMGASLAIETGARDANVVAVVEDSGYDTLSNVISARFQQVTKLPGALAAGMLGLAQLDLRVNLAQVRPIADIAHLDKPLLAIVGTRDTMVPPAEGYRLYDAAPGPKQLLVIPGAGHVAGYATAPALYKQTVLAFLARAFSGGFSPIAAVHAPATHSVAI